MRVLEIVNWVREWDEMNGHVAYELMKAMGAFAC